MARLDRAGRPPRPAHLRADRHRSRVGDLVGPGAGAGPAAPPRPGAPRGTRPAQADRRARDPYLDPDRSRTQLRADPGLGRAAVPGYRRGGARPGELEGGRPRAGRAGPARLHAEHQQQDPGRALQPAGRAGCARVRADRVGRAGGSVAAAGRDHDPGHAGTAGPDRRSLPHRAGPGPGASPDQLVTGQSVTVPDPVAIAKMCMAFTPFPAPLLTVGRVTDATVLPLSSGTAA